jgi:hypothetical protein
MRGDVSWAAGGKGSDYAHRPRRIIERRCDARGDRERGSAGCDMQEFATGKIHVCLRA